MVEEFNRNTMNRQNQNQSVGGILHDLERLLESSENNDFNFSFKESGLSNEEVEITRLLKKVLNNYKSGIEYDSVKYNLVSKTLGVGLWDMDIVPNDPANPNNPASWSPELRRLLGFNNERDFPNILGSWQSRVHPDDMSTVLTRFGAHLNDRTGRTPYDVEVRLAMKNGEYRTFRSFGTSERDSRGNPIRVAGAFEDITEKHRINQELETNNVRLKLLLQNIDLALWDMEVDPNDPIGGNNIFWWSDEFRRMAGFTDERDFPNVLSSWSDRIHPEDKERILTAFAAHLMDPTLKKPYNVEYRMEKKNGDYIWFF